MLTFIANRDMGKLLRYLFVLIVVFLFHTSVNAEDQSTSGTAFEEIPQFGGPGSTGVDLRDDNQPAKDKDFIRDNLEGWFSTKERMMQEHGLAYGVNYSTLYQKATAALGDDNAWGGIFQIPVSWTVLNRGESNTGTIVFKLENRHKISTNLAPQDLGIQGIGAASITGTQFSDKDWILTNLYWQQALNEGKFKFVVGQLDNTDFMDVYGMINPQTSFMNLSFSTNPTIGIPDQGFGAGFGAMLSQNFYLVGSLMDAAGDPADPGESLNQFFKENEYFKHIEIGYTGNQDRIYFDNIHLGYWGLTNRPIQPESLKAEGGHFQLRIFSRTSTCRLLELVTPMVVAEHYYKRWLVQGLGFITGIRMNCSVLV